MNDRAVSVDRALQAQIDRLVSGELPESERRNVLAWLDEDVRRWRLCGLAFLEAQTWEAAVADWPQATADCRLPSVELGMAPAQSVCTAHRRPQRERTLSALFAIAISLLAAFIAGAVAARWWPGRENIQVVQQPMRSGGVSTPDDKASAMLATVPVQTVFGPQLPAQLQFPVTTSSSPSENGRTPAISDYERKQWEKRGFELVEEVRYLPARLPDGRQVMVPVTKVHLKFKGTPVS